MIKKAIAFAEKAHEGQLRKGTDRPFIVHPMEVLDILTHMTDDEEILAAGVLHDTLEDCPGVTRDMLEEEFGSRVAGMVALESEDKSKTWMERKGNTIAKLRNAPGEICMIALADKLSNIRDIARDYPVVGEELWQRFRMKNKNIIGWYYIGVRDSLKHLGDTEAYREYCEHVNDLFDEKLCRQEADRLAGCP
jgi:(p)ppGpp synthase/HD superfamily hydrolase